MKYFNTFPILSFNTVVGDNLPIVKEKETAVSLPEKENIKKSYTSMKKQSPKKSSFFFLCAMAVIFWLTILTVKVEEKEVLQKINDVAVGGIISLQLFICYNAFHFTSIDIAEMMELKEKAEEESRILLKTMEHYTQQENNQTYSHQVDFQREKRAAVQSETKMILFLFDI